MKCIKETKFLLLILTLSVVTMGRSYGQFVQIESILVDACDGSTEGENEMVIFRVESAAVNVADIRIDGSSSNPVVYQTSKWPAVANSFLGWITIPSANYNTAVAKVAALNATINSSCGKLIIPTGGTNGQGLIPAGKKGLIITSTDVSTTANSFVNLTDTLYVIFQKPGNTSGHFTNYGTTGLRSLRLHKISSGTNEAVTYDKSLLINQMGIHAAEDGAGVRFTASGVATYYNEGCQAPFVPLNPDWTAPSTLCQSAAPVNLNTLLSANANTGGSWSGTGVSGNLFNPAGLSGNITITYTVGTLQCTATQSHSIQIISSLLATWNPPAALCQTSPALDLNNLLTAQAATGGTWSGTGVSGNSFNPSGLSGNINITYTVGTTPCIATESHSIEVVTSVNATWTPPALLCQMPAPIDLNSFLGASATQGGIWSGPGVTGTGYNPARLNEIITITYTVGTPPCSATESHILEICSSEITVPNVFTPNGDGANETFAPVCKNIDVITLHIYNRWGIKLYEGSGLSASWDGKNAGKLVPDGVYFYLIEYEDKGLNNESKQLQGSVTLLH